ncbi:MAG: nickel-responsive transcriptional regulator NikR [Rhodospirillales bacterium]
MERVTVTVDDDLLEQFDRFIQQRGYGNRSEAVRDIIRTRLEADRLSSGSAANSVGCLTYVFRHHERELARRLTGAQHEHHDLVLSTLHVHLDHDNCIEAMIVEGRTDSLRRFADQVMSERGVRHGHLHLVPIDLRLDDHPHGDPGASVAAHRHSRPKT